MKANKMLYGLRAYVTFVVFSVFISLIVVSCKDNKEIPDPDPIYTKAALIIRPAENVKITSATIVAKVVPNENETSVSFEYRTTTTDWITVILPQTFSGKDTITLSSDLLDLNPKTYYRFRVKAKNKGGEVISYEANFITTAYSLPAVVIKTIEKVTLTSATVTAKLVTNENDTQVSIEYKTSGSDWLVKSLPSTFNGKDSTTVTFDLTDLKLGTVYSFRLKAKNVAAEVVSSDSLFETYAVSDFDGNLYHTVKIGTQTWLKENFRGVHYANGDAIANVTDATIWLKLTTGAYCWYNNDSKIGEVYGGLYNWYVGADPRGLIVGWHVPVSDEIGDLTSFLGNYYVAGPALMEAGNTHWQYPVPRPGNNSTGFTALPNGYFVPETGTGKWLFMGLENDATLWTSDEAFGMGATPVLMSIEDSSFNMGGIYPLKLGFGIRLLKNK